LNRSPAVDNATEDDVSAVAVLLARTRFERLWRRAHSPRHLRDARRLAEVAAHEWCNPAAMRRQVFNRDLLGCSVIRIIRKVLRERVVPRQSAVLYQLRGRDGREGLVDRSEVEARVRIVAAAGSPVCEAIRADERRLNKL